MSTFVELDDVLGARIRQLADQSNRALDQIVQEAVTQYADRFAARQSFLAEADMSWDAYQKDGLHLTGAEVSAWLDGVGTDHETVMPECHD